MSIPRTYSINIASPANTGGSRIVKKDCPSEIRMAVRSARSLTSLVFSEKFYLNISQNDYKPLPFFLQGCDSGFSYSPFYPCFLLSEYPSPKNIIPVLAHLKLKNKDTDCYSNTSFSFFSNELNNCLFL